MTLLMTLIVVATALNGILAGISCEVALVKLPTRRHVGAVAYAQFARGSDLGTGTRVYPATAIGAALFALSAALVAYGEQRPPALLLPLSLAALTSIGHFLACAARSPAGGHLLEPGLGAGGRTVDRVPSCAGRRCRGYRRGRAACRYSRRATWCLPGLSVLATADAACSGDPCTTA
jgi:hypothetical protein